MSISLTQIKDNMVIDEVVVISHNGLDFSINKYAHLERKMAIISSVVEKSFIEGKFDYTLSRILLDYYIIATYTDIDTDNEDLMDFMNTLYQSGLMDSILSVIDYKEIRFLIDNLAFEIDLEVKNRSSIGYLIGQFLGAMEKNIPEMVDQLKKFAPEQYNLVKEMTDKITTSGIKLPK